MIDQLVLATSNPGKVREMLGLLRPLGIHVLTPDEIGVAVEVEETGSSFAENARLKADAYVAATGLPAIADDSGLVVAALGGAPGLRSARFGGPGLDDAGRVHLLLEQMRDVPDEERSARFVAAVVLGRPGRESQSFDGVVEGVITREPRGSGGFGYDPIFLYPPLGKTLAEVDANTKGAVSHRARAVKKLVEYLQGARSGDILVQPDAFQGER